MVVPLPSPLAAYDLIIIVIIVIIVIIIIITSWLFVPTPHNAARFSAIRCTLLASGHGGHDHTPP